MSRRKRSSSITETARLRLAACKSIDTGLDLGNGITIAGFENKLEAAEDALSEYNRSLSEIDEKRIRCEVFERDLADYSERVLLGVGSKFGRDSVEYGKAGGTRKSDRRRRPKSEPAAAA